MDNDKVQTMYCTDEAHLELCRRSVRDYFASKWGKDWREYTTAHLSASTTCVGSTFLAGDYRWSVWLTRKRATGLAVPSEPWA